MGRRHGDGGGRQASAGITGHDNDRLITEYAKPASAIALPASFDLEPGVFGGIESQLATNGSTSFAAVNNLAVPISRMAWRKAPQHLSLLSPRPPARWSRSTRTPARSTQRQLIVAYKLGAKGKLADTVRS